MSSTVETSLGRMFFRFAEQGGRESATSTKPTLSTLLASKLSNFNFSKSSFCAATRVHNLLDSKIPTYLPRAAHRSSRLIIHSTVQRRS